MKQAISEISSDLAQDRKEQMYVASLILTSRDPVVQHIAHLTSKVGKIPAQPIYRPTLEVGDIWQQDPDTNRKALLKKVKI